MSKIYILRFFHGIFALYFICCIIYLYYAAITANFNFLLILALISLSLEGIAVFILNKGDCPLIYIQNKLGDNIPFFELFLPKKAAKQAVPFFSILTWLAVILLSIRFIVMVYKLFYSLQ